MTTPENSLTVSITTFDRPEALSECLKSLSNQTDRDFDVVVVNGGERGALDKLLRGFSLPFDIKVVQQIKRGLVEARNLCWKEAKGDIVCIIDDDLVVSPGWIKEIRETFFGNANIAGVTGPTIMNPEDQAKRDALSFLERFEKGNFFWKAVGKFYLEYLLEGKYMEIGRILDCGAFTLGSNFPDCLKKQWLIEVDYLEACHMCFKRALIEQAGGFDYIYTGTSEWSEPDLAFRIREMGYKLVFNPKAVTEHKVSKQGVFKARTNAYERSVNFINFYYRNVKPDIRRKFSHFLAYLFFMDCYWVYKAFSQRNLSWLGGVCGTFKGLFRNHFFIKN